MALRIDAPEAHVFDERALGPFLSQIARHGGDEVVQGNARAPGPERGASGGRGQILDEDVGLQSFDRLLRAQKRYRDQRKKVCEQAPKHAMGQMVEMKIKHHFGPENRKTEGAILQKVDARRKAADQFRQQQRKGPDRKSGKNTSRRARAQLPAARQNR